MPTAATKRRPKKIDQFEIKDVSTLKAMADSTRLHILIELHDQPRTVKEVASVLGVRPTRLYYHFNMLERSGLIRVADRRLVSGIEERTYETVAESTTIAQEIVPEGVRSGVVGAMLNVVRAELELALLAGGPISVGDPESPVPMLSLSGLLLSRDQVEDLQTRLREIVEEFADQGELEEGERRYHSFLTVYQAPSELRRIDDNTVNK